MTAAAPTRSPFAESRVWLIGSALNGPLPGLLGYSRWQVERFPNLDSAVRQIEIESVPVAICGESEWRDVVGALRRSPRPPAVIVLTDAPKDAEWAEVLKAGAHYLDVRDLHAPDLFSLLSLLWRAWHKD